MNTTIETPEQQQRDADRIFDVITASPVVKDYAHAQRVVVGAYVFDETVSRAGISLALKRLEQHFNKHTPCPAH
jgi:hypothetical protein